MDKRYQVFISSTFSDLVGERREVMQTLMEMDCIPAGMELFPATDEEQFAFIKSVIDDCDYYILIIGGRYGSIAKEGISYTEKEYDYAISRGLPVVAFLHEEPESLPVKKSDTNPEFRKKLEKFRSKVSAGRLVKYWKQASDLPGLVALSLQKTIKRHPKNGWVRAESIASDDAKNEIIKLQKTVEKQAKILVEFQKAQEREDRELASGAERFIIAGSFISAVTYYSKKKHLQASCDFLITTTWDSILRFIGSNMERLWDEESLGKVIASYVDRAATDKRMEFWYGSEFSNNQIEQITVQLNALRFIHNKKSSYGHQCWEFTANGLMQANRVRAIKKGQTEITASEWCKIEWSLSDIKPAPKEEKANDEL